jgi:dTDP-4-dehydrorhamnose 3,5-epimerase
MEFIASSIENLYTIHVKKLEDERGLFARTFCKKEFKQIGFDEEFVQFNHSYNKTKGTLRGMHFQYPPYAEVKLIRCVQGAVFDVVVDLRTDSPTFLKYFSVELSAKNMTSILIPKGFAHGFQTLEDNTALIYHHTQYYTPEADAGLRFDDAAIGIQWKMPVITVSEKDKSYKLIDNNFKGMAI